MYPRCVSSDVVRTMTKTNPIRPTYRKQIVEASREYDEARPKVVPTASNRPFMLVYDSHDMCGAFMLNAIRDMGLEVIAITTMNDELHVHVRDK